MKSYLEEPTKELVVAIHSLETINNEISERLADARKAINGHSLHLTVANLKLAEHLIEGSLQRIKRAQAAAKRVAEDQLRKIEENRNNKSDTAGE